MTAPDPQPVLRWTEVNRAYRTAEHGGRTLVMKRSPDWWRRGQWLAAIEEVRDGVRYFLGGHGPDTEPACREWCETQAGEHATGGRD